MSPVHIAAPAALEQHVEIETPEQVTFSYTIAGVGSRAAAALIDLLICLAIMLLLSLAVGGLVNVAARGSALDRTLTAWAYTLFVVGQFLVIWGYYVLFEGMRDGQTPGKRYLGLRVVQDGGYSVGFQVSAVRNLARAIDMQPGFTYGVGILAALLTRRAKRLGDVVAGTIVVHERVGAAPVATAVSAATDGEAVVRMEATTPTPVATPTALLSEEEFALLEGYVARRSALDPQRRTLLVAQLATRFRERLLLLDGGGADAALLLALHERERAARRAGAAGRGATGARREQHAIVAQGAERWNDFARALADAQRRSLSGMREEEISVFVAQYRELSTDLARLRTAARGGQTDAVFYLSRLVAGGHNLFYRQHSIDRGSVRRFLFEDAPREVRRSARVIGLAALLLFAPALIAYTAVVSRPELAREFIPAAMIDRAEQGRARDARGDEEYVPDPDAFRPVLASRLVTNNVTVAIVAFAGGLLFGAGTVLTLVFNGVSLGGVLGLYHTKGIAHQILTFVAPHGVLELSAIAIAGGAGLLIGSALLLPGEQTRRDALVRKGLRSARLVGASAFLLLIAGVIEGFISPDSSLLAVQKLVVSATSAVALIAYLGGGRRQSGSATTSDAQGRSGTITERLSA